MCTVSVKVNEAILRDVMPELDSTAAIRLWVQKLVDMHLQQLRRASERDLIPDDVCREIWQEVEDEYKDMVFDDDETVDLETFRADLHKMIEDVYAEP